MLLIKQSLILQHVSLYFEVFRMFCGILLNVCIVLYIGESCVFLSLSSIMHVIVFCLGWMCQFIFHYIDKLHLFNYFQLFLFFWYSLIIQRIDCLNRFILKSLEFLRQIFWGITPTRSIDVVLKNYYTKLVQLYYLKDKNIFLLF